MTSYLPQESMQSLRDIAISTRHEIAQEISAFKKLFDKLTPTSTALTRILQRSSISITLSQSTHLIATDYLTPLPLVIFY